MDSNALERERGITILRRTPPIMWAIRINIVTRRARGLWRRGRAVLAMVDCVVLLVDAVDGPMPQTRFVTQKAFKHGLRPIVVINKIDRDEAVGLGARQTFDLSTPRRDRRAIGFPVVYASCARSPVSLHGRRRGLQPLFTTSWSTAPARRHSDGSLQLQVTLLDYSSYVDAIGIGASSGAPCAGWRSRW